MVREHAGDRDIAVPPTIHALLQARIDSLEGDVRVVMERGSVEGEVFHRGAVSELSPDPVRAEVGSHLATLVARSSSARRRRRSPRTRASASAISLSAIPPTSRSRRRPGRSCTSASQTGSPRAISSSVTRSLDTTWSRPIATARSSIATTRDSDPLAAGRQSILPRQDRAAYGRGDYDATRSFLAPSDRDLPVRRPARPRSYRASSSPCGRRAKSTTRARCSHSRTVRAMRTRCHGRDPRGQIDHLTTASTSWPSASREGERRVRRSRPQATTKGSVLLVERGAESWLGCRAFETIDACERSLLHSARRIDAHTTTSAPGSGRRTSSGRLRSSRRSSASKRGCGPTEGSLSEAGISGALSTLLAMRGDFVVGASSATQP